jgi:hypothetical protein
MQDASKPIWFNQPEKKEEELNINLSNKDVNINLIRYILNL